MSPRKPPPSTASSASAGGTFRQRYDELESRRVELLARLGKLGDDSRRHPGYRRALTLLNDRFRRARLTQRLAVLHAAHWLIEVLERLTTIA